MSTTLTRRLAVRVTAGLNSVVILRRHRNVSIFRVLSKDTCMYEYNALLRAGIHAKNDGASQMI